VRTRRPRFRDEIITLAHGSGGRATHALVQAVFLEQLANPVLSGLSDAAVLPLDGARIAFTTDTYVVKPLFFPGGDIGELAVNGTVNDLAVSGARPVALSAGFVIEEGFAVPDLRRIVGSAARAAAAAGVAVVAGDTKVVERGKGDGVYVATSGVGVVLDGVMLGPARVRSGDRVVTDAGLAVGDRILVTGTLGDHGLAIMTRRRDLRLEGDLASDVAPVNGLVRAALAAAGEDLVAMKDPTRGGLSSALHEMAAKARVGIVIEEARLPIAKAVRAAGEILGIDPLVVANEGKAVLGVRPRAAERVLAALREHPLGRSAAIVGTCIAERPGNLILDTGLGKRLVAELDGEPLPRIC